ncbi:MAG: nitroreductase [Bacteroidota bacterium]
MTAQETTALIRKRRSIFPPQYTDQPISDELIWEILENANWAPTHRLTEPWRFKVFQGAALERLSTYLGDWYKDHTSEAAFSERKFEKTKKKALQSSCVIAICMQRDPEERVPEWEEIAATAAAVQNMWLTCSAHGVGCYWSSPKSMAEATDFLGLQPGERCLGLLYMGYHNMPELPGKRQPIQEKVEWFRD